MPYVIAEPCIGTKDASCVEVCPVDCIYEADDQYYINPDECIDCSACEPVCPVEAITTEDEVPPEQAAFIAENARFFTSVLPGRTAPLGAPGGAEALGAIGVDTPFVQSYTAP
jgi:NAD-dependent dihydropyrimidine dehydrogenase PreA subunit